MNLDGTKREKCSPAIKVRGWPEPYLAGEGRNPTHSLAEYKRARHLAQWGRIKGVGRDLDGPSGGRKTERLASTLQSGSNGAGNAGGRRGQGARNRR